MYAILHAFLCGLTMLVVGAELISLDHAFFGCIMLFVGGELAGFGALAFWLEWRAIPARPPLHHP
jgi:CHASE2 domain-containing sensor protein